MFGDLLEYVNSGDVLVLNQTKVIPARLMGHRAGSGGRIEVLLLQRLEGESERWRALTGPARKARIGETIEFENIKCAVQEDRGEGEKIIEFDKRGEDFWHAIDQIGQVPLPPYLDRPPEEADKERYQTVFAIKLGAAAAPTAGLHFTTELLKAIERRGVTIAKITLHTGLGTFRPVEVEDISTHHMHEEWYELDEENAKIINTAKQAGKRVFAVGTTTVRTLETLANDDGTVNSGSGMSDIFIYPPYKLKVPNAIITNFHLPKSTLIMMISAFAGREFTLQCYEHAIKEGYRFYSYGDAMLIL